MEGPSDTAGDQWRQQRDLLAGRSGDDYVKSHIMCTMPVDSEDREMLSLHEAISSIAIEEDFGMDENDVDFNFENVERKELEMLEILPDACVNTLDKARRTVLHWAVAHDITWAIEELLESGKATPDVTFHTASIRNITAFHLILLHDHNLPYSYRRYLKDELKRDFCEFEFVDADFSISDFRPERIANVLYCGQYEWVGTNS
ncbi:unnamed protein product [Sphagnum jensenii]